MDKEFELKPYGRQKSYYGKAMIKEEDGISKLISYTTKVAEYSYLTDIMTVYGWFSSTTAKHINSFLNFHGFKTCNKQELENYKNE